MDERLGLGLIVAGAAVLVGHQLFRKVASAVPRRLGCGTAVKTPCGNPLPRQLHAVLPEAATRYRRVIIIGDVHGCVDEFQALLDKLQYRKGVDVLVQVGDLVNKGPDSEGVLKLAQANGAFVVRGNHDDSAYSAFQDWLAGRDIPKIKKQGWVAGLPEPLASFLKDLPFSLALPGYQARIVHAGMVPGVPAERQSMWDLTKMRDLVPQTGEAAADAAYRAVLAGSDPDSLTHGSFDWEAAVAAHALAGRASAAAAAAASTPAADAPSSSGSGGVPGTPQAAAAPEGAPLGVTPAGGVGAVSAEGVPAELRLVAREQPNTTHGRAWAAVWRGPEHLFFGHDAKRRLQLESHATGLDTGCVYGGQLTACVLPPLDELGRPLQARLNLPPDARELALSTGLTANLVDVPAKKVHSDKFIKLEAKAAAAAGASGTPAAVGGASTSSGSRKAD